MKNYSENNGGGDMLAHISMKNRNNTSFILPGPVYYINNFSSPHSVVIHSHICRREFTVASLFPLLASNTDLMTSLSIFGNISSIWKISKRYDSTILANCTIFFNRIGCHRQTVLCSSQSSCNWPSTKRWRERDRGVGGWVDRQTDRLRWWWAAGAGDVPLQA